MRFNYWKDADMSEIGTVLFLDRDDVISHNVAFPKTLSLENRADMGIVMTFETLKGSYTITLSAEKMAQFALKKDVNIAKEDKIIQAAVIKKLCSLDNNFEMNIPGEADAAKSLLSPEVDSLSSEVLKNYFCISRM